MILSDLDYLVPVSEESEIIGGNAYADTSAITSPNTAYASGVAFARGDNTYTDIDTRTKIHQIGSVYFAYAKSAAHAQTDTNRQTDRSISFSLSIHTQP